MKSGSVALVTPELAQTYEIVHTVAPNAFLITYAGARAGRELIGTGISLEETLEMLAGLVGTYPANVPILKARFRAGYGSEGHTPQRLPLWGRRERQGERHHRARHLKVTCSAGLAKWQVDVPYSDREESQGRQSADYFSDVSSRVNIWTRVIVAIRVM